MRAQGGDTALILAARAGNLALLEQLLANCTDTEHLHQGNHSGETAFDKAVEGFMLHFHDSINASETAKAIDCEHWCKQYSRIAWAILCKENGSASWMAATQNRIAEPHRGSRWGHVQSKLKRSHDRSRQRPSSAPTARRAVSRWPGTPTARELYSTSPDTAARHDSWEFIASHVTPKRKSPSLIGDGTKASPLLSPPRRDGSQVHRGHGAGTQNESVPQLHMTVKQFVRNLEVIKKIVSSGKGTWARANGFVLAMAVAVRQSAKASGAKHGLELVDMSAEQWSEMVQQHLSTIEKRELEEAEEDVSAPGFVTLAERRIAQSHSLKLFELLVELHNHTVRHVSTS